MMKGPTSLEGSNQTLEKEMPNERLIGQAKRRYPCYEAANISGKH